jgi:hypothetical protein
MRRTTDLSTGVLTKAPSAYASGSSHSGIKINGLSRNLELVPPPRVLTYRHTVMNCEVEAHKSERQAGQTSNFPLI